MNSFNSSIIHFINSYSRKSRIFDIFISNIVENNLIKGAVIVCLIWYFWFQKSKKQEYNRGRIIIGIVASIIAILLSRAFTNLLPFSERPFNNPALHFVRPYGMMPEGLQTWSSFPSDHAILFFAISTSIFLISKKAGLFCYIYTFLMICFPRVYAGYHYPTDILGGAIIGVAITLILTISKISKPLIQYTFKFSEKYTGLFYLIFFVLTYQMANLFDEGLKVASYSIHIAKLIIKHFLI